MTRSAIKRDIHGRLTPGTLRKIFRLDDGALYWRPRTPTLMNGWKGSSPAERRARVERFNETYANTPALPKGHGEVLGEHMRSSHIAVAMTTGRWPSVVRYRDGNPTNLKPDNLFGYDSEGRLIK